MEIKTAEQILREVLIEEGIEHGEEHIDSFGAIDAVKIAMIKFAKQFIDLAADKALVWQHSRDCKISTKAPIIRQKIMISEVDKQSILEIKNLIK